MRLAVPLSPSANTSSTLASPTSTLASPPASPAALTGPPRSPPPSTTLTRPPSCLATPLTARARLLPAPSYNVAAALRSVVAAAPARQQQLPPPLTRDQARRNVERLAAATARVAHGSDGLVNASYSGKSARLMGFVPGGSGRANSSPRSSGSGTGRNSTRDSSGSGGSVPGLGTRSGLRVARAVLSRDGSLFAD